MLDRIGHELMRHAQHRFGHRHRRFCRNAARHRDILIRLARQPDYPVAQRAEPLRERTGCTRQSEQRIGYLRRQQDTPLDIGRRAPTRLWRGHPGGNLCEYARERVFGLMSKLPEVDRCHVIDRLRGSHHREYSSFNLLCLRG
ncbi:MAG: hypothetical protein ACRYF2_11150 [Janthinobacterium lividum]